MRQSWFKYFLLMPGTLWLGLFVAFPTLLVFLTSFLSRNTYGRLLWEFQIDTYLRLFQWEEWIVILRSLKLSLEVTVVCLITGFPLAYYISRVKKSIQLFLLLLVVIPFLTSSLVRTYAWITLLQKEGLINRLLLSLGWIEEPLELLYNEAAVLLGMTYMFLPFMVLPLYAALEKLDTSLLDAARDLGAGAITVFLKIILPMSRQGILAGSLLVFVPSLGYFFIPDLLGGNRTLLMSNYIATRFSQARDWPFGATLSVLLILLTLALVYLFQKKNPKDNAHEKKV
ncbi:MAG: ABC transporter permease [Leptospiraceae bacterium]|nr:ABC transporter permease [Leptospiraceae bacterium]MDW8306915.1 ABC transporter permease [Leptospiraceae bacterium]